MLFFVVETALWTGAVSLQNSYFSRPNCFEVQKPRQRHQEGRLFASYDLQEAGNRHTTAAAVLCPLGTCLAKQCCGAGETCSARASS